MMEYITALIILEGTSTFRYISFSLLCYAFVSNLMSSKLDSNFLNYNNPHIIAIILGLFSNENEYKFGDEIRIH